MLGGVRRPDAAAPGGRVAPFVRMTDFLLPAACDWLLAGMLAARERFVTARVQRNDSGKVERELRIASRSDARINR